MVAITLPDGSVRSFDGPITGADLAADIGPGLAKSALAIRTDGAVKDLSTPLTEDTEVAIITSRDGDAALDLLRHDCAHVMAEAVQELFPGTQVTIGPNIEDGFFYDFARDEPFLLEDLEKIEAKMHEIIKRDEPIVREVMDRSEAIQTFKDLGEAYKVEIIEDIIPEGEEVSIYRQGKWFDVCRGPHMPSTGKVGKNFKLMKLAGAYWRGDSRNTMLQRIYGTAWFDKKELKAYLTRLEEAEKRDHRRLGNELDLFHFQEEAQGAVFWHPKGWTLFQNLIGYMRRRQEAAGYVEISTPTVMDRSLWELSGHWEKFGENMYTTEQEERVFALKPMNCPGGIQVYKQGMTSYRDLPRKIAEFGKVHRFEPSGALHGLMRVREFTQDDAHIFCTPEQMEDECRIVTELIMDIYKDFGFEDIRIKFSDRPEKRLGSDEVWDQLETALKGALERMGYDYSYNPGEGAFYGPKLEFVLRDAIGRDWQCGTLQVDMNLPERLDVHYIDDKGEKARPVMLHRALFGSLERFTGILTEHYAGKFPLWLAPVQVTVCTIVSDANDYALDVTKALEAAGIRAECDIRNEKINYKIREHSVGKIPVLLIVGKREAEEGKVTVRRLGVKDQETLALSQVIDTLKQEVAPPDQK